VIRGVKSGSIPWVDAKISDQPVTAAHYSQLAAISYGKSGSPYKAISVYYQSPEGDGNAIRMVSTSTKPGRTWAPGRPDMTPDPPPPRPAPSVRDPPLHGTALTAIQAKTGYGVKLSTVDKNLPIVYLQWDNLGLAHAQDEGKLHPLHRNKQATNT
jgi:hypothetical protein